VRYLLPWVLGHSMKLDVHSTLWEDENDFKAPVYSNNEILSRYT